MLRSIGKQSGESVESVLKKKGCDGKDLQKREVLSLKRKSEGVNNASCNWVSLVQVSSV